MTPDEIARLWPLVRRTLAFRMWAVTNEVRRLTRSIRIALRLP